MWQSSEQFQYTYCPISHELKATKKWNLVIDHGSNYLLKIDPQKSIE